jgi:hypothetical protein
VLVVFATVQGLQHESINKLLHRAPWIFQMHLQVKIVPLILQSYPSYVCNQLFDLHGHQAITITFCKFKRGIIEYLQLSEGYLFAVINFYGF